MRAFRPVAWGLIVFWLLVAAIAMRAHANACGPTSVGQSAVPITFPAPQGPTQYVTIVNPSATATLWVNSQGGTAAANAAGSMPLAPLGGYITWPARDYPVPATLSIISDTAATPITCNYQ